MALAASGVKHRLRGAVLNRKVRRNRYLPGDRLCPVAPDGSETAFAKHGWAPNSSPVGSGRDCGKVECTGRVARKLTLRGDRLRGAAWVV